jgi:peptide/nickel transport system substrate-binding protein
MPSGLSRLLMSRRSALRLVGASTAITVASACIPGSATRSVSVVPAAGSVESPRTGGIFRMGIVGDLARLDGHLVQGELQSTFWHVFDRLTAYDEHLTPQPMLAESWDTSADGRQLQLHLRKGVQFHSGREMTSEDVRWNFERIKDPKVGTLAARAQVVTGYALPDRNTLILKTDRAWTEAFDLLEYTSIIDPTTPQPDGSASRIGTGPFRFGEYVQGDHLSLVKNPNYWRSGFPYVDEFRISIGGDAQAVLAQLEGGALDAVDGPSFADAARMRQDPKYRVIVNERSGAFYCVILNARRAPTDNKLVRQALSFAIDRQRIVDSVMQGLGQVRVLPWAPTSPAFDASKNSHFAFDLDRARSLLQQAGVSNMTLDVSSQIAPPYVSTAQIVQNDLGRVGITASIKPLEPAVYLSQVQNVAYNGVMVTGGLNGQMKPMTMILGPYYGPEFNYSGFADRQYAALTQSIAAETDVSRQQSLYAALNDTFLDESWVIPVAQNPNRVVTRSNVRGLEFDVHEALAIAGVWIAT